MKKIILLICCILILSSLVNACSCISWEGTEKAYEQSATIFSGKVIDIDEPPGITSSADFVRITFEVYDVWKGEKVNEIEVYTAIDFASCGYDFELNKEYLVYTYESEGKLFTDVCNYPKLLSSEEAKEEVNELIQIANPVSIDNNNSIWKNSNLLVYAILFIIVFVFVKKLCVKAKEK